MDQPEGEMLESIIDEYCEMAAKLPANGPSLDSRLITGSIDGYDGRPRLAVEQPPAVRVRQIIKALKYQRTHRGLTIEQVAEASGVHKSVISRFENTSADPHLSTMLRYADAIGVDFAVLLDGGPVLHYDEQVLSQMMHDIQKQKNEAYKELIAAAAAERPDGIQLRWEGPHRNDSDS